MNTQGCPSSALYVAANFVQYALLTELPLFLEDALPGETRASVARLATTLPYGANVIVVLAAGHFADAALARARRASPALTLPSRKFWSSAVQCTSAAEASLRRSYRGLAQMGLAIFPNSQGRWEVF